MYAPVRPWVFTLTADTVTALALAFTYRRTC